MLIFVSYSVSQSVSGSDGGSAPGDDALIVSDEPQKHIPSEDLD